MLIDILFLDILSAHANDDSHLDLIVYIPVDRRVKLQVLPREQERGKRLVEPHGIRWRSLFHLGDMRVVVFADAEDLAMVLFAVVALVQRLHAIEALGGCRCPWIESRHFSTLGNSIAR